jgi:alanine racemase
MSRLGLAPDELAILAAEHRTRLAGLNLVLVMSHLACSDDADHAMNAAQLSRFKQALAMLPPAPASLAASNGTFLGAEYHFDLLRPGVALYGANPVPGRANPMQTAAVLTGKVLQLRRIDSGDPVGYAATFHARRPSMLATIALGYADGVPRALSNKGAAAIGGVRAPIAGRVSMDTIILDVTDFATPPKVGDDAEILGDTMSLGDVAATAGTNEYEILTRLRVRVPRHYENGASATAGATKEKST